MPSSPESQESVIELLVPPECADRRLDHAVVALQSDLSRSQIQRLIKQGLTSVNGVTVTRVSAPVAVGERIVLRVPEPKQTSLVAQALPFSVLYEDADIIVVDKPSGMVVHPAPGHADGTLVNALLHHVTDLSGIGGQLRPGIVHRLDKGTSGVMVVAKHDRAHGSLALQFRNRTVEKQYLALVWGLCEAGRLIEVAIGRDQTNRQRMSVRARRSRPASTRIVTAHAYQGVTLVRVAILTGRTHQIRVHLQAIGHPVVGDSIYGGVKRQLPLHLKALASLDRPFLHAAQLAFFHPTDGRRVSFETTLPDDLVTILDSLRAPGGHTS